MHLYWTLWIFDLLITGTAVYFFISGITSKNKQSDYYMNWMFIIIWLFTVQAGSLFLFHHQYLQWAYFLLLSIFIPSVLGLLFAIAMVFFNDGRWN